MGAWRSFVSLSFSAVLQEYLERLTNGGKLRSHMDDHDSRHDESENVHEVSASLEYDRVGQFDGTSVAIRLDACLTIDWRGRPN